MQLPVPRTTFTLWLLTAICLFHLNYGSDVDLTKEPGHLQKFGTGRPIHPIEEVVGFPSPEEFFNKYFLPQKPVKMLTGAKLSPAFHLWTDEYFLSLNIPKKSKINLETVKKESRQQKTVAMNFKKFVKIYHNSSYYMVDPVPEYLKQDLILPCCLQCPGIVNGKLVEIMMWFSGGGTNSVVHHDAVDNINCVYRGSKDFVIVDPVKYEGMVPIDRPEGSYSDIDVDSMDYTKYPTLANVEYIHAHLEPGDCLYIPYKWIHQVRSYNSNLAVNIWWNHYDAIDIDLSQCNTECDKKMSIADMKATGFDFMLGSNANMRDYIAEGVKSSPTKTMTYESFVKFIVPALAEAEVHNDELVKEETDKMREVADKLLTLVDLDADNKISLDDINSLPSAALLEIAGLMKELDLIQGMMDDKYESEMAEEDRDPAEEDEDFLEEDDALEDIHDEL